uniref:F-box domain-containing protein n=1 Tax=Calcidiscus leptoporus TaxID=127549 RepID=A0A7S0NV25_9EUKA|mmetsp:Transcript_29434/g.68797  ORF Transcript_29434/g.68797 Transcript_29434/m.68797 type:complete len:312 (+) Transcript_29434:33-968(+)
MNTFELPDGVLHALLGLLSPAELASMRAVCKSLRDAAGDEALWLQHCLSLGLGLDVDKADARSKSAFACFVKHARRRCSECMRPTPYEFLLLRVRLCEHCERAHPHKYGMATRAQLTHERSGLALLSGTQRDDLFRQLASLKLAGFEWFVRDQVLRRAEEWHMSSTGEGADATDGEDCSAGTESSCDFAAKEGLCTPATLHLVGDGDGDGDGAAGERRGGDMRRAALREEHKERKRRVKAEQRAKRQGATPPSAAARPSAAPRAPPRSKRLPVRQHRQCAQPQAWEAQFRQLEERFGTGLAGLSGLSLASE